MDGQVGDVSLPNVLVLIYLVYSLAARYPHKMKVEVIGKSWEGRDIRVVTVGNRLVSRICHNIFIHCNAFKILYDKISKQKSKRNE